MRTVPDEYPATPNLQVSRQEIRKLTSIRGLVYQREYPVSNQISPEYASRWEDGQYNEARGKGLRPKCKIRRGDDTRAGIPVPFMQFLNTPPSVSPTP